MESFEQTFGAKGQRKRPKVPAIDVEVTIALHSNWSYAQILCAKYQ